jgi:hypothetical protein
LESHTALQHFIWLGIAHVARRMATISGGDWCDMTLKHKYKNSAYLPGFLFGKE